MMLPQVVTGVGATLVLTAVIVALAYLLISGLVFLYRVATASVSAYMTFRGKRVVTCPETRAPAGVEVDARHAAATSFRGRPELRLQSCSRWPERDGCGQDCLQEIEAAPAGCLVRNMLDAWYRSQRCAFCGNPFGTIHWHDHKPALLSPQGKIIEWRQLASEDVPGALESERAVCWNCGIAETFRMEHPDLVTDRPTPQSRPRA
jgi:hypothetical protein